MDRRDGIFTTHLARLAPGQVPSVIRTAPGMYVTECGITVGTRLLDADPSGATCPDCLRAAGFHPCGRCRLAPRGAVDWGCICNRTPEQLAAEAAEFARIHD